MSRATSHELRSAFPHEVLEQQDRVAARTRSHLLEFEIDAAMHDSSDETDVDGIPSWRWTLRNINGSIATK